MSTRIATGPVKPALPCKKITGAEMRKSGVHRYGIHGVMLHRANGGRLA
jgi:hypothetical protein